MKSKEKLITSFVFILISISIVAGIIYSLWQSRSAENSSAAEIAGLVCDSTKKVRQLIEFENDSDKDKFNFSGSGFSSIKTSDHFSDGDKELSILQVERYLWGLNKEQIINDYQMLIAVESIRDKADPAAATNQAGLEIDAEGGIRYYIVRDINKMSLLIQGYDGNNQTKKERKISIPEKQNIILGIERIQGGYNFYYKLANSSTDSKNFINSVINSSTSRRLNTYGMEKVLSFTDETVDSGGGIQGGPLVKAGAPNQPKTSAHFDNFGFIFCNN